MSLLPDVCILPSHRGESPCKSWELNPASVRVTNAFSHRAISPGPDLYISYAQKMKMKVKELP